MNDDVLSAECLPAIGATPDDDAPGTPGDMTAPVL